MTVSIPILFRYLKQSGRVFSGLYTEDRKFSEPISPWSEPIQKAGVSHLIESPGVNSKTNRLSSPHRTAV